MQFERDRAKKTPTLQKLNHCENYRMYGNLNRMGDKSCIAKIGMNSMRNVTVCEEVEVLGGGELFVTLYLSVEEVEVQCTGWG